VELKPKYITRKEAAFHCSVHARTISDWVATKGLRRYKIGRCVRFVIEDLDEFMEAHAESGGGRWNRWRNIERHLS